MILLCGHYEGVDERVLEEIVTDYISIGDYVLTGGELPAMVLVDAISRMAVSYTHLFKKAGTGDRKISEMSEKFAQCPKSVKRYK